MEEKRKKKQETKQKEKSEPTSRLRARGGVRGTAAVPSEKKKGENHPFLALVSERGDGGYPE